MHMYKPGRHKHHRAIESCLLCTIDRHGETKHRWATVSAVIAAHRSCVCVWCLDFVTMMKKGKNELLYFHADGGGDPLLVYPRRVHKARYRHIHSKHEWSLPSPHWLG